MLVFVCRSSDERDEHGRLPQPFHDAELHPSGEWCVDLPEQELAGWVKTYGPVVAQVLTLPSGALAWSMEIYDQPRETNWPRTAAWEAAEG